MRRSAGSATPLTAPAHLITGLIAAAVAALLSTMVIVPAAWAAPGEPESVVGELLVGFKPGASAAQRAQARSAVSATLADTVFPGTSRDARVELFRVPAGLTAAGAIRMLQANPNVAFAEPNWVLTTSATTSDSSYTNGDLWGLNPGNSFGSKAGTAWEKDITGSKDVYIGVIDEGIDFSHTDLSANIWDNPFDRPDGIDNDGNGYIDDVRGWDFANNDNTIYDGGTRDRHGTHVAGTIGAVNGNGRVVGVNWNVTIISGKFLNPNGGSTANAIKAVDYFTNLKTRLGLNIVATNNSWGGGGYSSALYGAIVRAAQANILFIAAAGNSSTNNDVTASYPSNYNTTSAVGWDSVVAVAAIDSTGALASFSSYGATTVDLGAPGVNILSTLPGNTYAYYSGTSMATPHVSGAAALIASATGLTGRDLRARLVSSTAATSSLTGKTITGGRLDLSTLTDTLAPSPVTITASSTSVVTGSSITLNASASDNVGVTSLTITRSGTTLATSTSGTASATWTSGALGPQTFTATARDAANNTSTATVTVTVTAAPDTTPPTITSFTATPSTVTLGNSVTLSASANDAVGVTSLVITGDGTTVANSTSGSASGTWTPSTTGTFEFTATAKDAANNINTARVSVTVNPAPDTTLPTITSFTATPSSVTTGQTVTLTASASDNVGVTSMSISVNGSAIATSTGGSISTTWSTETPGTYIFTAIATDAANNNSTASSVTVTVNAPAPTPTVSGSVSGRWYGGKTSSNNLDITVTVTTNLGQLVSGATVTITAGTLGPITGTTTAGTVTFTIKNPASSYYVDIVSIVAVGFAFVDSGDRTITR